MSTPETRSSNLTDLTALPPPTVAEAEKTPAAKKTAPAKAKTAKKPAKAKTAKKPAKVKAKSTKKTAAPKKEKAPKKARVAGTKVQMQVLKQQRDFLAKYAKDHSTKENKMREADANRIALEKGLKSMGYTGPNYTQR